MASIRFAASFLGITLGMAGALAACFGPPFTLRAPAPDSGEGGTGGQGDVTTAGGGHLGVDAGDSGDNDDDTILIVRDSAGGPLPGINVVINDESGAVVLVTETGDDGHAEVAIPTAGSVSVFSTVETALHVHTIVEPPPGLTIPVIIKRPTDAQPNTTSYQGVVIAQPLGNLDSEPLFCDQLGQLDAIPIKEPSLSARARGGFAAHFSEVHPCPIPKKMRCSKHRSNARWPLTRECSRPKHSRRCADSSPTFWPRIPRLCA